MAGISYLKGVVKHYDWGGISFIPSLLRIENTGRQPFAEYWMGVHPQADCKITLPDGSFISLRDFIAEAPEARLGTATWKRFGNLPYLFKALDVRDMLSIQVHPSKKAAEEDYAKENKAGIPIDSPQRNYKDDNHKPELMVALNEFWLLHGFKPAEEIKKISARIDELKFLLPLFEEKGYTGIYQEVMEIPQEEVNRRLQPLLDRIVPLYNAGKLNKSQEDFWAARASISFSQEGNIDRGIFSIYLFNLVRLGSGQAIFQDAGVPHAYLEGHNVEIMASSDNVLRGGLTSKHIDVKELLRHVRCEATVVDIIKGNKKENPVIYKTPAPDFELSGYYLEEAEMASIKTNTTEILLLVKGEVLLESGEETITLKPGTPSAVIFPGREVSIKAKAKAIVFKAGVPGE